MSLRETAMASLCRSILTPWHLAIEPYVCDMYVCWKPASLPERLIAANSQEQCRINGAGRSHRGWYNSQAVRLPGPSSDSLHHKGSSQCTVDSTEDTQNNQHT
jgi:hypothetical protein